MKKQRTTKKIKDLEKRLVYLRKKYDHLTQQIGRELITTNNHGENIDIHLLAEEREIVAKYMQRLERQVKEDDKESKLINDSNKIYPGNMVLLKNNNHSLKFKLVEEIYSQEEKQISIKSPIGKAVIGRRVGETILVSTPRGEIPYAIKSIE